MDGGGVDRVWPAEIHAKAQRFLQEGENEEDFVAGNDEYHALCRANCC